MSAESDAILHKPRRSSVSLLALSGDFIQRVWRPSWFKRSHSQSEVKPEEELMEIPTDIKGTVEDLVGFYRGWDKYEKERNLKPGETRAEVIDSDLTGLDAPAWRFRDRYEVSSTLERVNNAFNNYLNNLPENHILKNNPEQAQLSKKILRASKSYLWALLAPPQERPELDNHIKNTMDVSLRWIDEDNEVTPRLERLEEILNSNELGFEGEDPAKAISLLLRRRSMRQTSEKFSQGFKETINTTLGKFIDHLELPELKELLESPESYLKFIRDPQALYFINTHFPDGKPEMLINTVRLKRKIKGAEETIAYHELHAHMLDLLMRKIRIIRGEVFPFLGLKTLHGPQVYPSEGLGQALTRFEPDYFPLSIYGELNHTRDEIRDIVLSNAHQIANQNGDVERNIKEAVNYAQSQARIFTKDELRELIKDGAYGTLERVHDYIYGVALVDFTHYAQALRAGDKQKRFLREFYGRPLDATSVRDLAYGIISEKAA